MLKLIHFNVIASDRKKGRVGRRPIREWFGTSLIEWGERIGGKNRRAESLEDVNRLMHLDIEMTRHGGGRHEGPWC